jgi:hypothetical protein
MPSNLALAHSRQRLGGPLRRYVHRGQSGKPAGGPSGARIARGTAGQRLAKESC